MEGKRLLKNSGFYYGFEDCFKDIDEHSGKGVTNRNSIRNNKLSQNTAAIINAGMQAGKFRVKNRC